MAADSYLSSTSSGSSDSDEARPTPAASKRLRFFTSALPAALLLAALLGAAVRLSPLHSQDASATGPAVGSGKLRAASQAPMSKMEIDWWNGKCPGNIGIGGYGAVSLVNAKWNVPDQKSGPVYPVNGTEVQPRMSGRTYFAEPGGCQEGPYDQTKYLALNLLGKTLRYTTDVSGSHCGCNAALYLVSMRQNAEESGCHDHYCDAMAVCGVNCAEIDIQEANMHAWLSTLHLHDDGLGSSGGLGGDLKHPVLRDFTNAEYGPGGRCVDTFFPFEVAASFPVNESGILQAMEVNLGQIGKPCNVSLRVEHYWPASGRKSFPELTSAMRAGMTPVISLWSSEDMAWFDGPSKDGVGPNCPVGADDPLKCQDSAVFKDMRVEDILTPVRSAYS